MVECGGVYGAQYHVGQPKVKPQCYCMLLMEYFLLEWELHQYLVQITITVVTITMYKEHLEEHDSMNFNVGIFVEAKLNEGVYWFFLMDIMSLC